MRTLIILVLVVMAIAVFAVPTKSKPKPPVKVYTNLTDNYQGVPSFIYLKFSRPAAQKFELQTNPPLEMKLLKSEVIRVWLVTQSLRDPSDLKSSTTYKVVITSPDYFIIFGQKVKKTTFSFTTPNQEALNELVEETFEVKYPIDIFLSAPYEHLGEGYEYVINPRNEKDIYEIEIQAPFNAGVHGPPIEEQLKQYYLWIAQAKHDALSWIRSKGQNPTELKIKWVYNRY